MSHIRQYQASSQSEMESQPLLGEEGQSRLSNDPQQDPQRVWKFIEEKMVDKLLLEFNNPTMGELKESFHDFDTTLVELETARTNTPKYYLSLRSTQAKLDSMKEHTPQNFKDFAKSLNNKIEVVTEKLQSEYKNLPLAQKAEKAYNLLNEFRSEVADFEETYNDLISQAWKEATTHGKLILRFCALLATLYRIAFRK